MNGPAPAVRAERRRDVGNVDPSPRRPGPADAGPGRIPRLASQIGVGPVVQDASVGRPGEAPREVVAHVAGVGCVTARGQVARLRPHARIDPVAARGRTVRLQQPEAGHLLARLHEDLGRVLRVDDIGQGTAVDLAQHFFRGGQVGIAVAPRQLEDRLGHLAAVLGVHGAQLGEQRADDLAVDLAFARRLGRRPVPLDHAAGVGEGARVLGEAACGQADDLGLDVFRLDVVLIAEVLPELGRLRAQRLDDDQELQLRHRGADLLLVGQRGQRVEALGDEAVDLALVHALEDRQHVVRAVPLGQVVVREVVFLRRRVAPPGLLLAGVPLDEVLAEVHLVRPQRLWRARVDVLLARLVRVGRRRQIARQHLGIRALVRDALHVGVAAQRVDAAARPADVAEQQLDHRRRADVLANRASAASTPART